MDATVKLMAIISINHREERAVFEYCNMVVESDDDGDRICKGPGKRDKRSRHVRTTMGAEEGKLQCQGSRFFSRALFRNSDHPCRN